MFIDFDPTGLVEGPDYGDLLKFAYVDEVIDWVGALFFVGGGTGAKEQRGKDEY